MAYQVLARKWRPQDFSSLIGQEHVVTALTNALSEGRIAQAYLFSGIRGVGKTTAARLLAKCLNCEQGPTATPDNTCVACREITAGSDLDVIEVDAATYSKVEQVRELTESLRYGPARDRYKVVVLDEIHRLSRQAFDALLKIVEEPPPHLVFVFATTESEAVPATVLSRCQEFHFRRVASPVLSSYLRTIAEAEEVDVSDAALRMISRAGEGSVRDSVALLDQLATFGAGVIDDQDAARLVGGLDAQLLHGLLTAVLDGHGADVSATARRLEVEGWDPRNAFSQFLAFARDALHLALGGGDGTAVDLPEEDAAALAELASGAGYENLLRLLHHLLASEAAVRRSESGYLAVEIAWLRAAELPKLRRVEELLSGGLAGGGGGGSGGGSGAAGGGSTSGGGGRSTGARRSAAAQKQSTPRGERQQAKPAEAARPAAPEQAPPEQAAPEPPASEEKAPVREAAREAASEPSPWDGAPPPEPPPDATRSGDEPRVEEKRTQGAGAGTVEAFLDVVRRRKQPLAAHLEADDMEFTGGALVIRHPPGDDWLPTRLGKAANRGVVDEAVRETWGETATWRLEEGDAADFASPEDDVAEEAKESDPAAEAAAEHPTVQTVLELFGGQIDTVEERNER